MAGRLPACHRAASAACSQHVTPPLRAHLRSRPPTTRAAAAADASLAADEPVISERQLLVKLSIAGSTGRLDLADCQLHELPTGLWELMELEDLSLAGNQLAELPADISRLTELRRLAMAGNQLTQIPDGVLQLPHLEGLWLHGNLLEQLPSGIGATTTLQNLSLAGNRLTAVPPSLGRLCQLQDLSLAGNQLQELPLEALSGLSALTKLALNGNHLAALPGGGAGGGSCWEALARVDELTVQGNQLTTLPEGVAQHLRAVTELSVADNRLTSLPSDMEGGWGQALLKLHAYGNAITSLPLGPKGLPSLGALRSVWLEANPLERSSVEGLLRLAGSGALPSLRALGLDAAQLEGVDPGLVEGAGSLVKPSVVIPGDGEGYFKLQRAPPAAAAAAAAAGLPRVLVVAFGSAPGLPNWGGALRKVREAATEDVHGAFDVLFVVDPHRGWYHGGDPALLQRIYTDRLAAAVRGYDRVVMLGDSMGATATLLMAPLATTVLAFCPQVNLRTSSIRPGQPAAWHEQLLRQLTGAVAAAPSTRVRIFSGTWQHDITQANHLAHLPNVSIKVYSVDSHRLALVLAACKELAPLLREAILQEMGLQSGNVRLANFF